MFMKLLHTSTGCHRYSTYHMLNCSPNTETVHNIHLISQNDFNVSMNCLRTVWNSVLLQSEGKLYATSYEVTKHEERDGAANGMINKSSLFNSLELNEVLHGIIGISGIVIIIIILASIDRGLQLPFLFRFCPLEENKCSQCLRPRGKLDWFNQQIIHYSQQPDKAHNCYIYIYRYYLCKSFKAIISHWNKYYTDQIHGALIVFTYQQYCNLGHSKIPCT